MSANNPLDPPGDPGESMDFHAFLTAQAEALTELLGNGLTATVETHVVAAGLECRLILVRPNGGHRYALVAIQSEGGFPAFIQAPHLPRHLRTIPVYDEAELELQLLHLLHAPETINVIMGMENWGG
jgi:hypothetical protein